MIPVPREKITDWLREFQLPEPEYDVDITIGEKTIQFALVFPDDQFGIVWGDQHSEQEWVDGWTIWICSNGDAVRVALLEISSRINGQKIHQEDVESLSTQAEEASEFTDEQIEIIYGLISQGLWDAANQKRFEYQEEINHTHQAWKTLEKLRKEIRQGRRKERPDDQPNVMDQISIGSILQIDGSQIQKGELPEYNLMGLFTLLEGEEFYTPDAVWVAQILSEGTHVWKGTVEGHATKSDQRFEDFPSLGSDTDLLKEMLDQLDSRATWVWDADQHVTLIEKWHFRSSGKRMPTDVKARIYDLRALCQVAFPTAQRTDRPESLCQELNIKYQDDLGHGSVLAALNKLLNASIQQLNQQDASVQAAQKQILINYLSGDWLNTLFPDGNSLEIAHFLETLEKHYQDLPEPVKFSPGQPEVEEVDLDEFFSKPAGFIAQIKGDDYEERKGQIEFANLIQEATRNPNPYVLEAGTGIGKTIGYLVPMLLSGRRTYVATHTKNLQEQAWNKDIPLVLEAMKMAGLSKSVSILKGKNNYVCLQTVADWLEDLSEVINSANDAFTFAAVLSWLLITETGWLNEMGILSNQRMVNELARDQAAPFLRERWANIDPHRKAIEAAESVDLVLTNHSYVFALAKNQSPGESTIQSIIFDEAHNIEDGVTETLTLHFKPWKLKDELASLLKRSSEGKITGIFRPLLEFPDMKRLDVVRRFQNHLFGLEKKLNDWCSLCAERLAEIGEGLIGEDPDNPVMFANKDFWVPELVVRAESLVVVLDELVNACETLVDELPRLKGLPRRLSTSLGSLLDNLKKSSEALTQLLDFENVDQIHWGEAWVRHDQEGIPIMVGNAAKWVGVFHSTPLDVSQWLSETLYPLYANRVFVSATLAVGGSFASILSKLGLESDEPESTPVTNVFPSSFEYDKQVLLSVFNDAYYPGESHDPLYINDLAINIASLAKVSKGRILVLFTSRKTLQQVGLRVRTELEKENIIVLLQTEGNRTGLIERFRNSIDTGENLVLLGLRAFWEGVDIPGDPLQILVISRLPFDYHGHPVSIARRDHYLAGGFDRDYFREVVIPNTFLHIRQMYGRLIRKEDDHGVCVFLDPRIFLRQYGKHLFGLLPVSQKVVSNRSRNLEQIELFLKGQTISPEFVEREPVVTSEDLSNEQRMIVDAKDKRILVRAAAGSGKTRVLIERIIHLIQEKHIPDPSKVLALTYTRKAQDVMNERLQNALGVKAYTLSRNVLTYHQFAARILRNDFQGTDEEIKWLKEDSQEQSDLFDYARQQAGVSKSEINDEEIKTVISFAQNGLVDEEALQNEISGLDPFSAMVAKIYLAYVRRIRELNTVDYGEAIVKAVQILRDDTEKLQKWANLFKWIFCDEYQDSTPAQSMLLGLLGQQANLFVVGDTAQSIYSWMGSDPDNLNRFQIDFPGTITYHLSRNYRNYPNLVRVSNRFLERCGQTHGIHVIWDEDRSNENQNVYYLASLDDCEEANKIAKLAKDALALPIPGEPPRYGTVGVLARKWNLLESLEIELIKEEVPYTYEGETAKGLRADLEISQIIDRAMNIFARSQTDQVVGDNAEGKIITDIRLGKISLAAGLLEKTKLMLGGNQLAENSYRTFRKLLKAFSDKAPTVINDLYEKTEDKGMVVLSTVHSQKGEEFDTVFVIGLEKGNTPHTPPSRHAQILEWRKVVQRLSLASWQEDLDEAELQRIYEQEEQRIFYVAMTRARLNLIIGYSEFRHLFGYRRQYAASEFLDQARLPVAVKEANEAYDITLAKQATKPSDGYKADGRMYWTNAGILVRSKSEMILANEFHRRGVFFDYESPVENIANVLPDFTLSDYGDVIIEHLGLLDDDAYRARWEQKREEYEKKGRLFIATNESEIQNVSETVDRILDQAYLWTKEKYSDKNIKLIKKIEAIRKSVDIKIGRSIGEYLSGFFEIQSHDDVSILAVKNEINYFEQSVQSLLDLEPATAISSVQRDDVDPAIEIIQPEDGFIFYFAYGSNLFTPILQNRVPGVQKFRSGYLPNYQLKFNKKSIDGSGKGNIVQSENPNDHVLGVIYKMPVDQKKDLDLAEGKGKGYTEIIIDVITDIGNVSAYTYIADNQSIDDSLLPYSWYMDLVISGLKHHQFPEDKILLISQIKTIQDPDKVRNNQNQEFLKKHKGC